MSIEQSKLSEELKKYLISKKITKFSPVQSEVIPLLFSNKGVTVEAPTGSGKTLSFLLPIINSLKKNEKGIKAIIFVPTRELAIQISNVMREILSFQFTFTYLNLINENSIEENVKNLKSEPNIIVSTPTKLMKFIDKEKINFDYLKFIIIDEIDMIYNFGFLEEILIFKQRIIRKDNKIWGLFSATFPLSLQNFIKNKLQIINTKNVKIENFSDKKIKINLIKATEDEKLERLLKLINSDFINPYFCLIFTKTNNEVNSVFKYLKEKNIKDLYFFNNQLSTKEKNKIIKLILQEKVVYLITTDLIARGIDFPIVTHIINFNYPADSNYYKHRIGRTNRLNTISGIIYDLFDEEKDKEKLEKIKEKNGNLIFENLKL